MCKIPERPETVFPVFFCVKRTADAVDTAEKSKIVPLVCKMLSFHKITRMV